MKLRLSPAILLIFSLSTHAIELKNYQEIEQKLNDGQLVTMVFKYRECKIVNPNAFPMKIDTAVFKIMLLMRPSLLRFFDV